MGLLLLFGGGGGGGGGGTERGTLAPLTSADTRLVLLSPDHNVAAFITDFREFDVELGLFEQGTLTVTLHRTAAACTATYDGEQALATNYGWAGTKGFWRLQYWRRGELKFNGVPIVVKKDRQNEGDAYVTLTARALGPELLRRRQIRTEDGAVWQSTATTWKGIARELVRQNCVAGALVTPTDYQQGSETRDDFKNFAVACSAPSGSGSEEYETEDRTNLWMTLCEIFNTDADQAEWLWPTFSESVGGGIATITVDFLVGRTGGGRAIGSDLSASIVFSTGRRNLTRFSQEADGTPVANQYVVAGKGIGISQVLQHVADAPSIANLGVIEDGVTVEQAGNAAALLREGQRKINEEKDAWEKWEIGIVETSNCRWGPDFDITDTATAYDGYYDETVQAMIVGIREHMTAPGHSELTLIWGKMQRSTAKDLTRHGGGGRGGRGGGGRTAPKAGQPETPPDDHVAFARWRSQSGSDMVADELADTGGAVGESAATYVRVQTVGADPGSAAGTQEKQMILAVGTYTMGTITPTGYVALRLDDGTWVKLDCEKMGSGAASPSPAAYGSS